jgi:hypothetical protein
MATSLAGNFLVEGEPFDVTKINKMLVAVQELQEKTASLENTLKLPDGTIKEYIPIVWGYRTPKLSLKGDGNVSGPFTLDWAKSPFSATEQEDGKISVVASLAEGDLLVLENLRCILDMFQQAHQKLLYKNNLILLCFIQE